MLGQRVVPQRASWPQGLPMALARVSLAVLWLSNVPSKLPVGSSCGLHGGGVLCTGMQTMAAHAIIGPYGHFIRVVVLPHYRAFAWATLSVEWLAGVSLLLGLYTRVGAGLGLAQSLNLFVGLAFAPGAWVWPYTLMVLLHLLVLTQARHDVSIDAFRAQLAGTSVAGQARAISDAIDHSEPIHGAPAQVSSPAQPTRTAVLRPIEWRRSPAPVAPGDALATSRRGGVAGQATRSPDR